MRTLLLLLLLTASARAAGRSHAVTEKPGDDLKIGVTFTLWIPDGVETLRGVIVHQHGCGSGACKGGETAAYDLQWQALARKHRCALLGPSYHQDDKQDCRLWCDPRNGSGKAFLRALDRLAKDAKRPELKEVPWCLWGHSGGAFWVSLMHAAHPERVVACWLRSGTAYGAWTKGEVPRPELSDAVYAVPVMLNPGLKEKGDKRFGSLWTASLEMFAAYRAKGAPIAVVADPRTGHECGNSRDLAIPYFDACLTARLPEKGVKLRPMPADAAVVVMEEGLKGGHWLPDGRLAKAWKEYVARGAVGDDAPPPAPTAVKVAPEGTAAAVTWEATAGLGKGLHGFVILRDGKEIGTLPAKLSTSGRRPFQGLSYHDTPLAPLPAMRFLDMEPKAGARYEVISVSCDGTRSKPGR